MKIINPISSDEGSCICSKLRAGRLRFAKGSCLENSASPVRTAVGPMSKAVDGEGGRMEFKSPRLHYETVRDEWWIRLKSPRKPILTRW